MPGKEKDTAIEGLSEMEAALEAGIDRLELKRSVPEGAAEPLGEGRGAGPKPPASKEKAILAESPRPARKLEDPLEGAGLAKGGRRYQVKALAKPDRHAEPRIRICEVFHGSRGRYGCRRIRCAPKAEGAAVSEKAARRVMAEGGPKARRPEKRGRGSRKGEMPDAPESPAERNSHADAPNALWPADATGLSIPAGKAYLSPAVDCFDGRAAARTMPTPPNAELAGTMPDDAAATLEEGEHPVGHNDRGCRYRRPGWAERCERCGIVRPMSRKGCSPDDSATEGFFGRLEAGFFCGRGWKGRSIERFAEALGDRIEWRNERRIELSLGGLSPNRYRRSLGLAA